MKKAVCFVIGLIIGYLLASFLINKYDEHIRRELSEAIIPTGEPIVQKVVSNEPVRAYKSGSASWYGQEYCDRYSPKCITASGEKFDETAFTCACMDSIPLGTYIKFTYKGNSVVAKCNDRGSFEKFYGRIADLSKASFAVLAPLEKGVLQVQYEVL